MEKINHPKKTVEYYMGHFKKEDEPFVRIAHTAPHLCDDPNCPGNINRQIIEMFPLFIDRLVLSCRLLVESHGCYRDCKNCSIFDVITRARALQETSK